MNRGRRRDEVFLHPDDYQVFLKIVREAAEGWNLKIAAYCLMSNHYHLLVQTPDANIARCMRHINGVYTQYFNRKHKQDGQLFRGRYKAVLVEEDSHLLEVMRYIHRNPLNAGLSKHLDEYLWCSHLGYLSSEKQWDWLIKDQLLVMLATKKTLQQKLYLDFVSKGEPQEITAFYGMKKLSSILGGDAFKEWVKNRFGHLEHQDIPESQILAVTPDRIVPLACAYFNIDESRLKKSQRGIENLPRDISIYLTRCTSRMTLAEIGDIFDINNYSTVSSAVERIKIRRNRDAGLQRDIDKLSEIIIKSQRQT